MNYKISTQEQSFTFCFNEQTNTKYHQLPDKDI